MVEDKSVEHQLLESENMNSLDSDPVSKDENSRKIRELISTALGCSPVTIGETVQFLHLGMDSLLMRQFSQQIKSTFNITVTVRQLMREYSSVQTLAAFINSVGTKGS
jgi:acyl carrier protein